MSEMSLEQLRQLIQRQIEARNRLLASLGILDDIGAEPDHAQTKRLVSELSKDIADPYIEAIKAKGLDIEAFTGAWALLYAPREDDMQDGLAQGFMAADIAMTFNAFVAAVLMMTKHPEDSPGCGCVIDDMARMFTPEQLADMALASMKLIAVGRSLLATAQSAGTPKSPWRRS